MSTFVDDHRYLDLNVMNLHLDDNQITSINLLEGSDWFYQFQVFSIRRNDLTEVLHEIQNKIALINMLPHKNQKRDNLPHDLAHFSSKKIGITWIYATEKSLEKAAMQSLTLPPIFTINIKKTSAHVTFN